MKVRKGAGTLSLPLVSLRLCVLTFTGLLFLLLLGGCAKAPKHFTHKVLNPMTPVKNQGKTQLCWAYAMLAAIETEHIGRGDSVNLSPAYIGRMLDKEPGAPEKRRGMGKALLNLMAKYGMVDYDAMPGMDDTIPRKVIARGREYTPKEFALSLCDSDEYIALTSTPDKPYGEEVDIDFPDNWMRDRFLNVPMDTLLRKTVRAVRSHRGVCWESSGHAMAIVGLARDDDGHPFFVMKNSWGTSQPHQGLVYMSFGSFREKTLAVEMPRTVFFSDSTAAAAAPSEQLQ